MIPSENEDIDIFTIPSCHTHLFFSYNDTDFLSEMSCYTKQEIRSPTYVHTLFHYTKANMTAVDETSDTHLEKAVSGN